MDLFRRRQAENARGLPPALSSAIDAAKIRPDAFGTIEIDGIAPIWKIVVRGDRAIAAWEGLSRQHGTTGYWPVIVGTDDDVERIVEIANDDETTPDQIIAAAGSVDVGGLFEERVRDSSPEGDPWTPEVVGTWPAEFSPNTKYVAPFDVLSHKPLATGIALVPATRDWDVPAYLRWGSWNECPAPSEHVAILKRWSQIYGAQLVAMTSDVVECHIPRPPKDREAAMALAKEQFAYCSDVVHQGMGSVSALASIVMNAPVWYFWWD